MRFFSTNRAVQEHNALLKLISRGLVPLLISTGILVGLVVTHFSRPCVDPVGCFWLHPGEPLIVALPRITSGAGLDVALAVQQGADLAAASLGSTDGHRVAIQPFFSPCLPELSVQSTIDLAGANRVVAILGPTCTEDVAQFSQRMSRAGQVVISPLPFLPSPEDTAVTFTPDLQLMAQQAVEWLPFTEITTLTIIADPDPASQNFRDFFCGDLVVHDLTCESEDPESSPTTLPEHPALLVWISLLPNPTIPQKFFGLSPDQSALAISFSPPPTGCGSRVIFTQWIGPTAWKNQQFLATCSNSSEEPPPTFASLLSYFGTNLIHQAALETAQRLWDRSWLIPRQAFQIHLAQIAAQSDLYQYSCPARSSNCRPLPLTRYQWSEKDNRFVNP